MHDPPPQRTDSELLDMLRKDRYYLDTIQQDLEFIRKSLDHLTGIVFAMLEHLDV